MKIIIFGATELTSLIASEYYQKHDVIIIDKEENKSEEFNKLDLSFVYGNASNINILRQADIFNSDVFIAATELDESNIVACLTAKRLSGIKTICFVKKEEYKESLGIPKEGESDCRLYIDYVIWPEELLMMEIFNIVTVAHALDVENFANGKARLLEYKIKPKSTVADKKIKDCGFPDECLIVGVTRNSELFIPYGDTILREEDKLIIMGSSNALDVIMVKYFHEKEYVKSIAIIGGGNVGMMLAKNLEQVKIHTTIIEKTLDRSEYLSRILSDSMVIHGDGTDLKLLNDENIGESDAVISVTNNDERNLLCSLLAKQLGVKRAISRVSKAVNIPLFEKVGIDVAVSPKSASLNAIRNALCEMDCDILASVEQGKGEIIEIKVPERFNGKKIMDLKPPARAVIAIVQRRGVIIIPKGQTELYMDDNLIIFTLKEDVKAVRKYFKEK